MAKQEAAGDRSGLSDLVQRGSEPTVGRRYRFAPKCRSAGCVLGAAGGASAIAARVRDDAEGLSARGAVRLLGRADHRRLDRGGCSDELDEPVAADGGGDLGPVVGGPDVAG